jgi:hypothetical protein
MHVLRTLNVRHRPNVNKYSEHCATRAFNTFRLLTETYRLLWFQSHSNDRLRLEIQTDFIAIRTTGILGPVF